MTAGKIRIFRFFLLALLIAGVRAISLADATVVSRDIGCAQAEPAHGKDTISDAGRIRAVAASEIHIDGINIVTSIFVFILKYACQAIVSLAGPRDCAPCR